MLKAGGIEEGFAGEEMAAVEATLAGIGEDGCARLLGGGFSELMDGSCSW